MCWGLVADHTTGPWSAHSRGGGHCLGRRRRDVEVGEPDLGEIGTQDDGAECAQIPLGDGEADVLPCFGCAPVVVFEGERQIRCQGAQQDGVVGVEGGEDRDVADAGQVGEGLDGVADGGRAGQRQAGVAGGLETVDDQQGQVGDIGGGVGECCGVQAGAVVDQQRGGGEELGGGGDGLVVLVGESAGAQAAVVDGGV